MRKIGDSVDQMIEVWYTRIHLAELTDDELKFECKSLIAETKESDYFSKIVDKQEFLTNKERQKLENLFMIFSLNVYLRE